jgi:LysM repeat protein
VRKANLRRLLSHVTGKTRIVEQVRTGGIPILQLLHSEGQVLLDRQRVVENGISLEGSLAVKVMYITGDDKRPYVSTKVMLPYEYTLEVPGIQPADLGNVTARLEQLQVNMLDGEELSVKAVPVFSTTVFQNVPIGLISQVKVGDIDSSKLANLPGMVIYMVQPGDNLWNIGKRYYVPVKSLRELNGLGSDELKMGQKLLIVKGS